MRAPIKNLVALLSGLLWLSVANGEVPVTITYQEPLEQLQLMYTRSAGDQQKAGVTAADALRFNAFGRRFDINLEENRSLLNAELRGHIGDRYQIYRGDIAGMPKSWVRLVIKDDIPRGMLWDGAELWAIEAQRDASTSAASPFMYRLSDLQIPEGALGCSTLGAAKNAGEFAKAVMSEVTANAAQGPGATSQIDIAVIADFEFASENGASTRDDMIERMNNVDGIFSMQLGVQMDVNRVDIFTANNDPFTDQLNASELLKELSDYRFETPTQNANGLSHLFTGRNLETTTVGIAWTSALCNRRYGASLTQVSDNASLDTLVAAHEFGHNFGAPHDGTDDPPCDSVSGDFLMATSINGSDEFSSCSITEMQDDIARAQGVCITALAATDVALLAGSQPGAVLLGDTATVSFDTNSVGTDAANGVNIDVTIPAGVTLSSVSSTIGNCDSGAGGASCAIGTVAAGSGATVTLTAETSAVGSVSFVASVTADADANANNNQASVQIDIDPAVDLVATAAAATQVLLDGSTTIRPRVENRSSIAATDVSVTVEPGTGLSIDGANWTPGTCSITDNVATCVADNLAPQSNDTLQIEVTGTSEGTRSYSINVSAAETDRATANNDVSGQVTVAAAVTTTQSGGGSSGGGSAGWLSILLLTLIAVARRRRL